MERSRAKKKPASSLRSLAFLKSLQLTEPQTRKLLEMYCKVIGHPEDYTKLLSTWQHFVDAQELIAGQLKYRDWEKVDGKMLVSFAEGRFALQHAIANFLPKSVALSDEDRRGLLLWNLFLNAFEDDDTDSLRECALYWQAFPWVCVQIERRAKETKNKAGFLRALHLYFSESEDKNMYGADLIRNGVVKEISRMEWDKLPWRLKSELYVGSGTQKHPSANILAHSYEALARDRKIDPLHGLQQWLDGFFNDLPVEQNIRAEKPVEDAFDRRVKSCDVESLKAGAADLQAGTDFTRDYERKLVKQFCAIYPGDKALLYALYRIEGKRSLDELARRKGNSLKTIKQHAKDADGRFRDWMKTKLKS